MNGPHLKAEWHALWRSYLDDHQSRMQNPEAYRGGCHAIAKDMLDAEVIDQLEKLELDEMADAAYWHAVEELISAEQRYESPGHYNVVPCDGEARIGQIIQGIFYPNDSQEWQATVIFDKGQYRLAFRITQESWPLTGMTLTSTTGQVFDLIMTARTIKSVVYPNIDDVDIYRALADAAQLALENHDFSFYQRARPLLNSAQFTRCSQCQDRFALREECQECGGQGVVPKPPRGATV
ncbi:hypothetical protein M1B35_31160 [Pseudomonas sp. MAFF 302046]|uniref:Zinc ribbon domain-containing protein n=2 Tax=Pseudomonas morbosilactucae TaxID=2938197 RepID=A0ABT0JRD5_9PSED|nr:hypothetical protein [Pseudomonas morbosilactucae]